MSMDASEFVGVLFMARDMAHRRHLAAKGEGSFAEHMALGDFYESIVDLADKFAEQYQGRFDKLLNIPEVAWKEGTNIKTMLRQQMEYIDECREQIAPRKYTSLHNVIDEIVGAYERVLYKLAFLR